MAKGDICTVEGCGSDYIVKVGYCNKHYIRFRKYGDPLAYFARVRPRCRVEGCGRKAVGDSLCGGHYQRAARGQDLGGPIPPRVSPGTLLIRDEHGRKMCRECSQWKAESEFQSSAGRSDGLSVLCRLCTQVIDQLRKYNLTPERYKEIMDSQGGVCVICKRQNPAKRRWAVDHDHACCPGSGSCGKCVRGILCGPCNGALGAMQDDVNRLKEAARYLERTRIEHSGI